MIDLNELRDRAATFGSDYLTDEEWVEVIDRLEAAEKERDEFKRACFDHISDNSMLRAKIERMEKQVPICRAEDLKHAESLLPMLGLKPESHLYALPGAQPALSVPPELEPNGMYDGNHHYASGWNDCRAAMLEARPAPSVPDLDMDAVERQNDELKEEVGKLRDALALIADQYEPKCNLLIPSIARSALCATGSYGQTKARPTPSALDGWLRVIDEALVVTHLGVANADDSYEAAKAKLHNLIGFHVDVATDPAVNGGWQLVPIEPTQEMRNAWTDNMHEAFRVSYRTMIAAAPKPEGE